MKQKSGFSGQLGFVFAAAGSAVGVGNLWRFPYLAAKDGGGLFLIVYLALVLSFGSCPASVSSMAAQSDTSFATGPIWSRDEP